MKIIRLLTTLAIVSVVLITGCKKDTFVEIGGVCPVVVSTNPANAATGVFLDKVITATFNEKMNPLTITQASFTVMGATIITGTVTYSDSTASFAPSGILTPYTTYTASITNAVKDMSGNALQTDYVWTFSTGGTVSPSVLSTDPANNATNVYLNKTVTALFSIPIEPITASEIIFTIKQGSETVAGIVSYDGSTGSFNPVSSFIPGTVYTGIITIGTEKAVSTVFPNSYIWIFTTGYTSAPYVISTDPGSNETNVVLGQIVTATFSEPMDPLTLNTTTFTIRQGTIHIAGAVTFSGITATFTPVCNLESGNTYTGTITTGAMNPVGISIAENYVWNFSTTIPLGPLVVDLKTVGRFGIIAGVGISNNAGFSEIHDMDVGISPGVRSSITGFPPAIVVNGAIYASDDIDPPGVPAMLVQAKQDLTDAYLFAEGASSPEPATVSGDLGGTTLTPGIYKTTSTLLIQSGDLTLDAQGDVNAVWIFQVASDFTTIGGAGGNVILTGGAQAGNIFWQVGSSATIGDFTSFKGNILALTSITMNSGADAVGRMLARNGAVVLTSTNIINKP